jgi:hypothetical protein
MALDAPRAAFCDAAGKPDVFHIEAFLGQRIAREPLDQLAEAALRPAVEPETARLLFEAYDAFLGLLADAEKRTHLRDLTFDELGKDALFREASGIGYRFQQGLDQLFFGKDVELGRLLRTYGVF